MSTRASQLDLFDRRRRRSNASPRSLEEGEQIALMQWVATAERRYPDLALLYHVPNGEYRAKRTAQRLKAMGTRRGVPDLHLPVPRGPFAGLWIELKRNDPRARVQPEQSWWINQLRARGHRAEVCRGWEAAKTVLIDYLNTPESPCSPTPNCSA